VTPLATQDGAQRRRANFFRDTIRDPSSIMATEQRRDLTAGQELHRGSSVVGEPISERDKLVLIEQHITAFATTLPEGTRSEGDKQNIRSRAMRGGSSTSAILASVMQASAVVRPTLQPQIVNYYSGATSTDPREAVDSLGLGARMGTGSPGAFGARGGYFGRGDYSGVGLTSGNMSSSSYLSNPGSVSMINYASTPYAATSMTHSTFSYLRDDLRHERFSGTNILHSGQDARTNGFSPNNRVVAKAFAVLDRDDGARREARNAQLGVFDGKLANDAEIIRLKGERDKATGEARAKLDEQLIARGMAISQETGTRKFLDDAPTAAAREQGRVVEMEKIKKVTGAKSDLRVELGEDAMSTMTTADNTRIAQAAIGQPKIQGPTGLPAGEPILQTRADELRRAASSLPAQAAVMGELAALDAKPSAPPEKAASATVPPAAVEAGQTKTAIAATTPTVAPVQTAEAKPAAKPKAPGASMSV
jgi:hypothetical protein